MSKNTSLHSPITKVTFQRLLHSWNNILNRGEVGCVVTFSRSMVLWRLKQLEETWEKNKHFFKNKQKPHVIDFESNLIEDGEDLKRYIEKVPQDSPLFFVGCDTVLKEWNADLLSVLDMIGRKRPYLWFVSINPLSIKSTQILDHFPTLVQNILYQPLYQTNDALQFVSYLGTKWQLSIPDGVQKQIVSECQGVLWLVKHALRIYRDAGKLPKDWIYLPDVQMRVKTIWNHFSTQEQKTLKAITERQPVDSEQDLLYLKQMGWLSQKGKGYEIVPPLLKTYVNHLCLQVNETIAMTSAMELCFSKQERAVAKCLYAAPGKVIGREVIAETIWGKHWAEHYSDWTIDQLISRVRKRLVSLGLSKHLVKTVKGKGFVWAN